MRKLLHWFGNENSHSSSEEPTPMQNLQNFNGLAIQVNVKSELCLPRNFITNVFDPKTTKIYLR